jgi:hypothetical protein
MLRQLDRKYKQMTVGYEPNEITPMAWNTPSFMVKRGLEKVPLNSVGTMNPCVTTVTNITIILINASVLAFANCFCQLCYFQVRGRPTFAISL